MRPSEPKWRDPNVVTPPNQIERAEPSRGAPPMTPDQFYRESDWHTSLGVAAKDMPPALIVTSRETAFAFAEAYAKSRHVVLLEALKVAKREMVGLAAYMETCEPRVIVDNLPSLAKALNLKVDAIEAVIQKAEGI